jgi:hypothetical protein
MSRTATLCTLSLLFVLGCKGWHAPDAQSHSDGTNVLRTYQIPAGHQKDVERMLDVAYYPLSSSTTMIKARPAFVGGLMVLSAPEAIQEGVAELIRRLDGAPATPSVKTIEVTYWLVIAHPADKELIDQQLAALQAPLKELARVGTFHYELLERLQLSALDGQSGKLKSRLAKIQQTAGLEGDHVSLDFEMNTMLDIDHEASMHTALRLKPEQFGVLGEVGWDPSGKPLTASRDIMFVIARARAVE